MVWTFEPATGAGCVVVVVAVVVVVGATVVVVGILVVVVVDGADVVVVVATSLRTGESAMATGSETLAVAGRGELGASDGPDVPVQVRVGADVGRALSGDAAASVPPWINRSGAISTTPQRSSPT